MTTSLIYNFRKGEATLIKFIGNENYFQKGFYGVNFSNLNTKSKPVILAGSIIEVEGDLYRFASSVTPTGTPTGIIYIRCYLSGSSLLAEFTATAPTYDSVKRGYYATTNDRYLMKLYSDGTNFTLKQPMNNERFWLDEI